MGRLDFVTMVLNPPDGNNTNCNLDQFLVTGGSRVPPICGLNTGQHSKTDKKSLSVTNNEFSCDVSLQSMWILV